MAADHTGMGQLSTAQTVVPPMAADHTGIVQLSTIQTVAPLIKVLIEVLSKW
jgi:hypothetical protein